MRLGRTVGAVAPDGRLHRPHGRSSETEPADARIIAERVRKVLVLAKRGRTAEKLASILGPYQSKGGVSRSSYYGWDNDPRALDATALAKAIELAGHDAIAVLFPLPAGPQVESIEAKQSRMESELAEVKRQLADLLRQAAVDSEAKQG